MSKFALKSEEISSKQALLLLQRLSSIWGILTLVFISPIFLNKTRLSIDTDSRNLVKAFSTVASDLRPLQIH